MSTSPNGGGGAPARQPSRSPSIVSLLNHPDEPAAPYSDSDYFTPTAATDGVFQRNPSPTPATAAAPRTSHKRPRTAGDSPSSSSASTTLAPSPTSGAAARLDEGSMEPPTSRIRRSSSLTAVPSPSQPSQSGQAASASAAPARAQPQPAPPPAPTPVAAPPPRRPLPANLPLEPSVFNVEPIDEFTREVADWLWGFAQNLEWDKVEIEAKIGVLLDQRAGGQRVHLPVPIETILMDDTGLRFDANMSGNQHAHFNQLLNMRVEESADPSYPHARVRYTHTRELDSFHQVPNPGGGPPRKVRVTRDQKDPTKVRAVEKIRVADMNVYSPKRLFDWRVSVSLEIPTPVPDGALTSQPVRVRYKDRISYSHQLCQVDLTKVQTGKPTAPPTHELEVEVRNAKQLLDEAAKDQRGEENKYLEMVQVLLNNIRMLIRNAAAP
ncbi:hypothetical protein JCM3774_001766 [Rhodotorula dairenensis]